MTAEEYLESQFYALQLRQLRRARVRVAEIKDEMLVSANAALSSGARADRVVREVIFLNLHRVGQNLSIAIEGIEALEGAAQ